MTKYREILEAVRAAFPEAKTVSINILTTEGEMRYFSTEFTEYSKDKFFIGTPDEGTRREHLGDGPLSIQIGTLGTINVKSE